MLFAGPLADLPMESVAQSPGGGNSLMRQWVAENHEGPYERAYGSFTRSFTLPSSVDVDRIEANTDNGVLLIMIPKAEKAKPRQIQVKAANK